MDEESSKPKTRHVRFEIRFDDLDGKPLQRLRSTLAAQLVQHMEHCTFCARRERLTQRLVFVVRTKCQRHEAPEALKTRLLLHLRSTPAGPPGSEPTDES